MRHTGRRSAIVAALIVLSACGGDDAEPVAEAATAVSAAPSAPAEASGDPSAVAAPGLVTPQQGAQLAAIDSVVVLDVRTPAEYAEGHLVESDLLLDFNAGEFAAGVADLDPDADYVVYCRSGNRSGQAVAIMRELGFERVWDLSGGILAWEAAGLPIDR